MPASPSGSPAAGQPQGSPLHVDRATPRSRGGRRSLAPGRDDCRTLHDGPLVLVGGDHGEAVGFAAFPGGTIAVFVELPDAFAPRAAINRKSTRLNSSHV